jgi:hypothetical protein
MFASIRTICFFVVLPLLFERIEKLVQFSAGLALLSASLRTFRVSLIDVADRGISASLGPGSLCDVGLPFGASYSLLMLQVAHDVNLTPKPQLYWPRSNYLGVRF